MRREHKKFSALVRPKVGVQLGSFLFFLFASLISCKRVPGTQGGLWLNSHTHPLKSPAQGGSRRGRGAWWRNLGSRDCDGNWRAWKRMRGRRLSGCRLTLSSFFFYVFFSGLKLERSQKTPLLSLAAHALGPTAVEDIAALIGSLAGRADYTRQTYFFIFPWISRTHCTPRYPCHPLRRRRGSSLLRGTLGDALARPRESRRGAGNKLGSSRAELAPEPSLPPPAGRVKVLWVLRILDSRRR